MSEIETTAIGEALYSVWHRCWDACQDPDDPYGRKPTHRCYELLEYPITKVTAKRIYFRHPRGTARERERDYFIARDEFTVERADGTTGIAYHSSLRELLYLDPNACPRWRNQVERLERLANQPTVSELRKAMANAHPDRGGDRESFETARRAYLAARARAGVSA